MNEEIFRKKSLDRVKSPENLDDYIRVSNPGVWLILVSVIILLAGACVWGVFGHIDSTVPVIVRVENGDAVCYISEENISSARVGMTVKLADCDAVITDIGENGESGYSCVLSLGSSLADGFYDAKLVVESYRPMSFVLN